MGLLGPDEPDEKTIEGILCHRIVDKEGRNFPTRAEAERWKREAEMDGFIAHVRSNSTTQDYELWVSYIPRSELPGEGMPKKVE